MKKLLLFLMMIPFLIKAQDGAYQGYKFKIPQYANTYNRVAFFDTKGYLKPIPNGVGYLYNNNGVFSFSTPSTVTNLATVAGASTVTITSDTGTDALIPAATTSLAGVMTASDKTKLNGIAANADNYGAWSVSSDGVNDYSVQSNSLASGYLNILGGNGIDQTYSVNGSGEHVITSDLDIKGLSTIANPDANYNLAIQSNSGSAVRITIGDIENYIGTTAGTASRLAKRDASADLYAHNFILSSDINLKKNIKPLLNTDWTNKIDFKQFEFIDDPNHKTRFGVIAQDIEKLAPELVSTDEQGNKAVAYIDLLIAKIAEMDKRIKELEYKLKEVSTR